MGLENVLQVVLIRKVDVSKILLALQRVEDQLDGSDLGRQQSSQRGRTFSASTLKNALISASDVGVGRPLRYREKRLGVWLPVLGVSAPSVSPFSPLLPAFSPPFFASLSLGRAAGVMLGVDLADFGAPSLLIVIGLSDFVSTVGEARPGPAAPRPPRVTGGPAGSAFAVAADPGASVAPASPFLGAAATGLGMADIGFAGIGLGATGEAIGLGGTPAFSAIVVGRADWASCGRRVAVGAEGGAAPWLARCEKLRPAC